MKRKTRKFEAANAVRAGARFRLLRTRGSRRVRALAADGRVVLHLNARSAVNDVTATRLAAALNEWSEIKASNEALHRRLIEAEAALVRIANDESLVMVAARELAATTLFPK